MRTGKTQTEKETTPQINLPNQFASLVIDTRQFVNHQPMSLVHEKFCTVSKTKKKKQQKKTEFFIT